MMTWEGFHTVGVEVDGRDQGNDGPGNENER